MARRRRVPRYLQDDPAWREADARRAAGIPCDAIAADPSQQAPNSSPLPPRFYQDIEFICADCGAPQVWTAEQQKWWYEVAKGSIYSRATRCRACRAACKAAHRGTPPRSNAGREEQ